MRRPDSWSPAAIAVALVLALGGCGGGSGPAPSAACGLGGVANETEFGRHFTAMALEDDGGGHGTADPDAGGRFEAGSLVLARAAAAETTAVRICVDHRDGSGRIAADITVAFGPAEPVVELGRLDAGDYVVRVGVGDVLVRNLPFAIR